MGKFVGKLGIKENGKFMGTLGNKLRNPGDREIWFAFHYFNTKSPSHDEINFEEVQNKGRS